MPIRASSVKYLQPEDVTRIIRAAPGIRDKAILAVMYNCGLRRSEIALLRRDDFVNDRGHAGMLKVKRLKKGSLYEHEIPLWSRTSRLLRDYLATRADGLEPLFLSRVRAPVSGQAIYLMFRDVAESLGLPADLRHPHVLRHSIGVHLRNMGIPIDEIREHLGHDDINTTLIYARVLSPTKTRSALLAEHSHHIAGF